jgi:hypothetical protein
MLPLPKHPMSPYPRSSAMMMTKFGFLSAADATAMVRKMARTGSCRKRCLMGDIVSGSSARVNLPIERIGRSRWSFYKCAGLPPEKCTIKRQSRRFPCRSPDQKKASKEKDRNSGDESSEHVESRIKQADESGGVRSLKDPDSYPRREPDPDGNGDLQPHIHQNELRQGSFIGPYSTFNPPGLRSSLRTHGTSL